MDVYVSRGKVGYFLGFPEKVSTIYLKWLKIRNMNKQKCLSLYEPLLLITNIHYCFCSLWTTASRMPCAQPEKKSHMIITCNKTGSVKSPDNDWYKRHTRKMKSHFHRVYQMSQLWPSGIREDEVQQKGTNQPFHETHASTFCVEEQMPNYYTLLNKPSTDWHILHHSNKATVTW